MSLRYHLAQSLEQLWWRRYLGKQNPEKYIDWKRNYWIQFLEKLPSELIQADNQNLADLGCGPAGVFMVLQNQKITAVDPLLSKYETTTFFDLKNYPWVNFKNAQIENLEPKEEFDGAFCLNAINHVQNLQVALQTIEKSLKPGGWLVLSSDVHKRKWSRKLLKNVSWIDPLHPQQDHAEDYENAFQDLKLNIQSSFRHGEKFLFEYRVWILRKA
jgi:2-polyprenyl-6-hydroxyphenyl methylase/3-demethylubiquinone-9 3-methyltransferase